jgi:release factor glutamine methyltransferase
VSESGISIRELLTEYRRTALELRANPRDVDLLLATVLGKPLTWLIAHDDEMVEASVATRFHALVERRFSGEPLQYIRGFTEFYGRDFLVDDRVLIPRPETELLVEHVLVRIGNAPRIIDLGTGSGCIATTLKLERPAAYVAAADISLDALALANANARRLGASVHFVASDVTEAIEGTFDVIASNPPYIPSSHVEGLQREVRDHEPHCALTPGSAGTEIIARIFASMHRMLLPGGWLVMEIGYSQGEQVRSLATEHGVVIEEIVEDLAGIPRIVIARRH